MPDQSDPHAISGRSLPWGIRHRDDAGGAETVGPFRQPTGIAGVGEQGPLRSFEGQHDPGGHQTGGQPGHHGAAQTEPNRAPFCAATRRRNQQHDRHGQEEEPQVQAREAADLPDAVERIDHHRSAELHDECGGPDRRDRLGDRRDRTHREPRKGDAPRRRRPGRPLRLLVRTRPPLSTRLLGEVDSGDRSFVCHGRTLACTRPATDLP
jgi:hypothetical protein